MSRFAAGGQTGTGQPGQSTEVEVVSRTGRKAVPPQRFRVLLHDDDFTTMDFVVRILTEVFGHSVEAATRIMLEVHHSGIGLAGIYPFEVAEAKAAKVIERARAEEFPFLATIEPVESRSNDPPGSSPGSDEG